MEVKIKKNLSKDDIVWLKSKTFFWQRYLLKLFVEDTEKFFLSLTKEQWETYQKKVKKRNDKYYKLIKLNSKEQKKEYFYIYKEKLEYFLGSIEKTQQDKIIEIFEERRKNIPFYLEQSERSRQNFVNYFIKKPQEKTAKKQLSIWIQNPELIRDLEHQEKYLDYERKKFNILIHLNSILTKEQRIHIKKFLQDLRYDLEIFSSQEKNCKLKKN